VVDAVEAPPVVLSYTEHINKADAALAALIKIKAEQDALERERGHLDGKGNPKFLALEHDLLTLMQIVNMHANMAGAKAQIALLEGMPWAD
jgi:hypothetical protein